MLKIWMIKIKNDVYSLGRVVYHWSAWLCVSGLDLSGGVLDIVDVFGIGAARRVERGFDSSIPLMGFDLFVNVVSRKPFSSLPLFHFQNRTNAHDGFAHATRSSSRSCSFGQSIVKAFWQAHELRLSQWGRLRMYISLPLSPHPPFLTGLWSGSWSSISSIVNDEHRSWSWFWSLVSSSWSRYGNAQPPLSEGTEASARWFVNLV